MGYITKAVTKLFKDDTEGSPTEGQISCLKISIILFLLTGIFLAEFTGERHEQIKGYSEIKPSNVMSKMFNQEHNVKFVNNNKSCTEKYVSAIVENYHSVHTVPLELYTDDCKINRATYSKKAIEQFHRLKNKRKFRIKYISTEDFQKIYSVSDYNADSFSNIVDTFNTLQIKGQNRCVILQQTKVCGVPNIHRGTYEASFILDSDNNIIQIVQLNKIQ